MEDKAIWIDSEGKVNIDFITLINIFKHIYECNGNVLELTLSKDPEWKPKKGMEKAKLVIWGEFI